jgi:type II secretion system protein I
MAPEHRGCEAGFTLIEALVALAVVAMVVIGFLGIRTSAIVDATEARNWRLAREIAEERMSELAAGARETPAESGVRVPIERYEGFAYKIVIGEADVADVESETASNAVDNGSVAGERLDWQRNRDDYRRASSRGDPGEGLGCGARQRHAVGGDEHTCQHRGKHEAAEEEQTHHRR